MQIQAGSIKGWKRAGSFPSPPRLIPTPRLWTWGSTVDVMALVFPWDSVLFYLFIFGCPHGMQKFLGQRSNPHHSSDNLTHWATREIHSVILEFQTWDILTFFIFVYLPYYFIATVFYASEQTPTWVAYVCILTPIQNLRASDHLRMSHNCVWPF